MQDGTPRYSHAGWRHPPISCATADCQHDGRSRYVQSGEAIRERFSGRDDVCHAAVEDMLPYSAVHEDLVRYKLIISTRRGS